MYYGRTYASYLHYPFINNQLQYFSQFRMGNSTPNSIDLSSQYIILSSSPLGTLLQHKQTSMNYILKQYTYALETQYERERSRFEAQINCPTCENILNVHKIKTHTISGLCSTTHKIYVIFEYPQVTLADEISARSKQSKYFEENELWSILQSINLALSHLKSTVSINTRNIFITPEGTVKTLHSDMISEQYRYTVDSNYLYAPQKLINFNKMDSELAITKEAVFSMGITILQAALLQVELYCYNFDKMVFEENQLIEYIEIITNRYSSDFVEMVEILVSVNPNSRPTIKDVQKMLDNFWSNSSQAVKKQTQDANQVRKSSMSCQEEIGVIKNLVTIASNQKQSVKPDNQEIKQSVYQKLTSSKQSNTAKQLKQGEQFSKTAKDTEFKVEAYEKGYQDKQNIYTDPRLLDLIRKDLQNIKKLRQSSQNMKNSVVYPKDENIFQFIQDIKVPQKNKSSKASKQHPNHQQISNKFQSSVPPQQSIQNKQQIKKQASLQLQQQKYIHAYSKSQASNKNSKTQSVALVYCQQVDNNGHLYSGYTLNGQKHGRGKLMFDDGAYYEGQFLNNQMNGQGILYYLQNKPAYEGKWLNDQFHGPGILYNEHPQPLNGQFNFSNFDEIEDYWIKYQGQFDFDTKCGIGKLYLTNGQIIEGLFDNDSINGQCRFLKKGGECLLGVWDQNKLVQLYQTK